MQELRSEERWAAAVIQRTLGVPVEQHDDGSLPGMHDLAIRYPDGTAGAVEITAAADAESIQLWNLMNGKRERWLADGLQGGWLVTLEPTARAKRLLAELPGLLADLEEHDLTAVPDRHARLSATASDLAIVDAFQGGTDFPGSIYVTIELPEERSGRMVANTGDALAAWIGDFLSHPDRSDVLHKLERADAAEAHAFAIVPGFSTAPFGVTDLLMRGNAPLPTKAPRLPRPVTHVWAMSTWSAGVGMRWCPQLGWRTFDKTAEN